MGETLHQKKITGKLSEAAYTEGSDIPLSSYAYEDVKTYEVAIKPYRKQTTLQEVKKRGYAAADFGWGKDGLELVLRPV